MTHRHDRPRGTPPGAARAHRVAGRRPRWRRRWWLPAALALLLAACTDVPYYWQAGVGQLDILNRRRPIDEVLHDGQVAGETKRKLRIVLRAQAFASESLALPPAGHYRYFADLQRDYVSWLVVAAPPLALQEHRFCFLVVGCLGYKGYFQRADAEAEADALRREGLDAAVRPVRAYSTLGWFDDPVLNTFLDVDDTLLVGTIIHEQAHQRYFLAGATAFNESFAEFVEHEGVQRFIAAEPDWGARARRRYRAIRADRRRFAAIVRAARERLEALYAADLPREAKLVRKARILDDLRRDYQKQRESFKILNYDNWFARPLNNAHLVGFTHYTRHVAAFRALFVEQGRDFRRFYEAVERLGELPAGRREARLNELEASFAAVSQHP